MNERRSTGSEPYTNNPLFRVCISDTISNGKYVARTNKMVFNSRLVFGPETDLRIVAKHEEAHHRLNALDTHSQKQLFDTFLMYHRQDLIDFFHELRRTSNFNEKKFDANVTESSRIRNVNNIYALKHVIPELIEYDDKVHKIDLVRVLSEFLAYSVLQGKVPINARETTRKCIGTANKLRKNLKLDVVLELNKVGLWVIDENPILTRLKLCPDYEEYRNKYPKLLTSTRVV